MVRRRQNGHRAAAALTPVSGTFPGAIFGSTTGCKGICWHRRRRNRPNGSQSSPKLADHFLIPVVIPVFCPGSAPLGKGAGNVLSQCQPQRKRKGDGIFTSGGKENRFPRNLIVLGALKVSACNSMRCTSIPPHRTANVLVLVLCLLISSRHGKEAKNFPPGEIKGDIEG